MLLFLTSYLAGILTILAPCVLPILPIIIGGSAGSKSMRDPLLIIASLGVSILIFTLVLRTTALFFSIPSQFWTYLSGGILVFFGLITLFPKIWTRCIGSADHASKDLLQKSSQTKGWLRPIAIGAALGPVFTSCSPTYTLILATVLPASYLLGVWYILVYIAGLASVLLLIAFFGQKVTARLRSAADPNGWFKKVLGGLFLIVGLSIIFSWDKKVEAWIIDQGYFGVTGIEENLVNKLR